MSAPRGPRVVALVLIGLAITAGRSTAADPNEEAETILRAGQTAFADGNLAVAGQKFQQVLDKFGNTRSVNAARYGLGRVKMASTPPDWAKAIEVMTPVVHDGGFSERGQNFYHLAVCQRQLGFVELGKAVTEPGKAAEHTKAAEPKFAEAATRFREARDWFTSKKMADWSGRARCDESEMYTRVGRLGEARSNCEPFVKDASYADNPYRPLGMYYYGLAYYLENKPDEAGEVLNRLAPFDQPGFGTHARYLVGRLLLRDGEAEAAVFHFEAVLADVREQMSDARSALAKPERLAKNPVEKARLEALANGPPPEYAAGAAYYLARHAAVAGRLADALAGFRSFTADYPASELGPDAAIGAGSCLVRLDRFDEAISVLEPIAKDHPRLADQALYWVGRARHGRALATKAGTPEDRTKKFTEAAETFRQAAERAGQLVSKDPPARDRQKEYEFAHADALQAAGRAKDAAVVFERLWHEQALKNRRDELLARVSLAFGAAADRNRSDQRADEFLRTYPDSVFAAAVQYRRGENAVIWADELAGKTERNHVEERNKRLYEAASRFTSVVDDHPASGLADQARFAASVCRVRMDELTPAVKALDAISPGQRVGDLSAANYLLADCLIRLTPDRPADTDARQATHQTLTRVTELLDDHIRTHPSSPDLPMARLKLGRTWQQLGTLAETDAERDRATDHARAMFETIVQEHPKDTAAGYARLGLATHKANGGDADGAVADLRAMAGADLNSVPVAPLAAIRLSTLLLDQNRPEDADKVMADARAKFEATIAKDPERAGWVGQMKYQQALARYRTGKYDEAKQMFDQVYNETKGRPISIEAALGSVRSRFADQREELDEAVKMMADAQGDSKKLGPAGQRLTRARQEYNSAAEQAADWAARLNGEAPDSDARTRIYYEAAWAFRAPSDADVAKAWDDAREQAARTWTEEVLRSREPGVGISVTSPPAVPRSAVPLQGFESRARATYQRLATDMPTHALAVEARLELAEMLAERAEHPAAIDMLRAALDVIPTDRPVPTVVLDRVRMVLGGCLFAEGEYLAAAEAFDAVAANPRSRHFAEAVYHAGVCRYSAGKFRDAADVLAAFRDRDDLGHVAGVSDRAVLRLGQAYLAAKMWPDARAALELFVQRYGPGHPLAADARYGIGVAQLNQEQWDDAVTTFRAVTAASTTETAAQAQTQIGHCRLAQGRFDEAAAAFLVVPTAYDYPDLRYAASLAAAEALVRGGHRIEARRVLARIVEVAPAGGEWAVAAKNGLDDLAEPPGAQ